MGRRSRRFFRNNFWPISGFVLLCLVTTMTGAILGKNSGQAKTVFLDAEVSAINNQPQTLGASNLSNDIKQTPQEPAQTPAPAAPPDVALFKQKTTEIINKYKVNSRQTSVAYIDLTSGAAMQAGVTAPYAAASATKVITAALYLSRVEQGKATLNDQINGMAANEAMKKMIVDSDNEARQAFNDLLGRDSLTAYGKTLGMQKYDATPNTIIPSDLSLFYQKLYKKQLLNEANTTLLMSLLEQANERGFLVATAPQGVNVYHKAGYLEDRVLDAAIFDNGSSPYVLVVFIKAPGAYAAPETVQIFKEIAQTFKQ